MKKINSSLLYELFLVEKGVKPACIFLCNTKKEKEELISTIRFFYNILNLGKDMIAMRIEEGTNNLKVEYFLFSKCEALIKLLNYLIQNIRLTEVQSIYILGIILGYPECCIKNYVNIYRSIKKAKEFFENYKKKLKNSNDPFELKLVEFEFHKKYICHLPCSPYCKESLAMRRKFKRLQKELVKKIIKKIKNDKPFIKSLEYNNESKLCYRKENE